MPRKAEHVKLLKYKGTNHISNDKIEQRELLSVDIGEEIFKKPKKLYGKKRAGQRWKFVTGLYKKANLQLVTSADKEIIARYCFVYDEYYRIDELKEKYYNNGEVVDMDEYLRLVDKLMKLNSEMLKLENMLYLTPVSRARTGGKPSKKPEKSELEQKGFANL